MRNKITFIVFTIILFTACSRQEDPVPPKEGKILVLMYHRIVKGEATDLYERSVLNFEADLKYLRANEINVLNFSNLEAATTSGKMPYGNSVIITFDDGDHSWYPLVKPLLLQYKMKATFFLWTHMIGQNSFLTWNEVEEMSRYTLDNGEKPFIFGSHTFSHAHLLQDKSDFGNMDEYNSFLDYELRESKELIESHVPGEVTGLSLPFGDGAGDPDIISGAKRNGYKYIRTSKWEVISNPAINLYAVPSLPILDTTRSELIGYYLNL